MLPSSSYHLDAASSATTLSNQHRETRMNPIAASNAHPAPPLGLIHPNGPSPPRTVHSVSEDSLCKWGYPLPFSQSNVEGIHIPTTSPEYYTSFHLNEATSFPSSGVVGDTSSYREYSQEANRNDGGDHCVGGAQVSKGNMTRMDTADASSSHSSFHDEFVPTPGDSRLKAVCDSAVQLPTSSLPVNALGFGGSIEPATSSHQLADACYAKNGETTEYRGLDMHSRTEADGNVQGDVRIGCHEGHAEFWNENSKDLRNDGPVHLSSASFHVQGDTQSFDFFAFSHEPLSLPYNNVDTFNEALSRPFPQVNYSAPREPASESQIARYDHGMRDSDARPFLNHPGERPVRQVRSLTERQSPVPNFPSSSPGGLQMFSSSAPTLQNDLTPPRSGRQFTGLDSWTMMMSSPKFDLHPNADMKGVDEEINEFAFGDDDRGIRGGLLRTPSRKHRLGTEALQTDISWENSGGIDASIFDGNNEGFRVPRIESPVSPSSSLRETSKDTVTERFAVGKKTRNYTPSQTDLSTEPACGLKQRRATDLPSAVSRLLIDERSSGDQFGPLPRSPLDFSKPPAGLSIPGYGQVVGSSRDGDSDASARLKEKECGGKAAKESSVASDASPMGKEEAAFALVSVRLQKMGAGDEKPQTDENEEAITEPDVPATVLKQKTVNPTTEDTSFKTPMNLISAGEEDHDEDEDEDEDGDEDEDDEEDDDKSDSTFVPPTSDDSDSDSDSSIGYRSSRARQNKRRASISSTDAALRKKIKFEPENFSHRHTSSSHRGRGAEHGSDQIDEDAESDVGECIRHRNLRGVKRTGTGKNASNVKSTTPHSLTESRSRSKPRPTAIKKEPTASRSTAQSSNKPWRNGKRKYSTAEEAMANRKERNRIAAQRSREKRTRVMKELLTDNDRLRAEVAELRKAVRKLQSASSSGRGNEEASLGAHPPKIPGLHEDQSVGSRKIAQPGPRRNGNAPVNSRTVKKGEESDLGSGDHASKRPTATSQPPSRGKRK
ncbi:hypothetical protein HDU67_002766 [Dinochytrium kinnereticum]|nr:hypothetical protein HDU67_002766 [Dinochytrium kinnereticum]